MTDNVTKFPEPPEQPPLLIGPFSEWRVVVDGKMIPHLTGYKAGEAATGLVLDRRFAIDVPNELAYQVAWMIANALAIGAGYSHLGAPNKDRPFAPGAMSVDPGQLP